MTSAPRLTTTRLQDMRGELSPRYLSVLPHLKKTRVLTGAHLDRLLTEPDQSTETTARVRRRIMTRLTDLGLVSALERRIGGVRAGSAGHIYTLTTAGHKILELTQGNHNTTRRVRHRATSPLFLTHALTISGIYVNLVETGSTGNFRILRFDTEPASWWTSSHGTHLRPDAYAVLHTKTHADCWWLEIDQGSENTPRLRAKITAYLTHADSGGTGPDGALPRVLFTTPDQPRAETIQTLITKTLTADSGLITVTTHEQAAAVLAGELAQM